ncbi:MAG TPA: hypothetical protein VG125_02310 [Pirellulales bacterium]|jgi:hypothetical protein|nr:hypothetical protein [Pirellulales bacterium]
MTAAGEAADLAAARNMDGKPSSLEHRRLRAPRGDREVLALPAFDLVGDLLAGVDRASRCRYDVQGRSLCDVSAQARQELLFAAQRYTATYRNVRNVGGETPERILIAGHQPQLFHPGVWFKNFALDRLARTHRATAVNLVIDSDTLKDASLRVPGGSVDEPVQRIIPFDDPTGEIPFARRAIRNRQTFERFGRAAVEWLQPLVDGPLINSFWPKVVARSRETNNLGECLAQARHQLEGEWGSETLELPQSQVCRFEAFFWFVAHLLAHLPRFVQTYNDAVVRYRTLHGIRSANHPVPELMTDGEWLEAPFWLSGDGRPGRRHLFVRRRGDEMILSDREGIEATIRLGEQQDAARAVTELAELAQRGIQLQTRALTTTLFARLFLGDLFMHGIGGGKYDQLTDELVRDFFLLEPPPFMVLSATLYLPVKGGEVGADDVREVQQRLRGLQYHPERYLDLERLPAAEARRVNELVAAKRRWINAPQSRENARQRCQAIRSVNESLQAWLDDERRRSLALREQVARRSRAENILRWREYAFCLYPEATLREFFASAARA